MKHVRYTLTTGLTALVLAIGMAGPAQAILSDIGGGIIFDDDTNLSWLQNGNTAAMNPFGLTQSAQETPATGEIGSAGLMSWFTANDWITAMNAATYLGFTDWRLPITTQPDATCSIQVPFGGFPDQGAGSGCTGSEMGHLFNVEMVTPAMPGLFTNVQATYWSGTEFAPNPDNAWFFSFGNDTQGTSNKANITFAWAVRSGAVSAPVIPEPSTMLLLGTGLAGLFAWRMRKGRA